MIITEHLIVDSPEDCSGHLRGLNTEDTGIVQ